MAQEAPNNADFPDPHWSATIFAVWNLIIRPPRSRYSRVELMGRFPGQKFRVCGRTTTMENFELTNPQGAQLVCTIFEPAEPREDGPERERACVVYCHGNGGNRMAGFQLLSVLLSMDIALVCFDFAGSGMSGGQYVSLGFHEKDDLRSVVEHLRRDRGYSRIALWGYSMGAAAALMHAAGDPSLAGVVADSPFSNLWQLMQEVIFHFVRVPWLLASPFLHLVRLIIRRKASFDICEVSPLAHVGGCFVPALFLHGEKDDFVAPAHTELLQRSYKGEAQRLLMPGKTHAAARCEKFQQRAVVFLVRALRWEQFLPPGMGEGALASLAAGHVLAARGLGPSGPCAAPAALERELAGLLGSPLPGRSARGLVLAACELCGAYRGAKLLPGKEVSAASPARFTCRLTLASERAEVALCWVSGGALAEGGRVHFAVITPTTLSTAHLVLRRRDSPLPLESIKSGARRLVAGLVLESIESADLKTVQLAPGRPHDVALRVHAGGVELRAGGEQLDVPAAAPVGDIHLCLVRWCEEGDVSCERLEASAPDAGPPPPPPRHDSLEVHLAETLATLCLGPPRGRPRSHVFLVDEDDCPEIPAEYAL